MSSPGNRAARTNDKVNWLGVGAPGLMGLGSATDL